MEPSRVFSREDVSMIEHLVLFKFKPEVGDNEMNEITAAIQGLKSQIPGIVQITCGKNFSARAQGHQFGLVARFVDKAALELYSNHPAHLAVVETLNFRRYQPRMESVTVVDYLI